jgi:hypothetical protein
MFRFSIRELMLVTLVVGLVVGWGLDHLRLSKSLSEAEKWRKAAGALEHMLSELGWKTKWEFEYDMVELDSDPYGKVISTNFYEPSHRPME